MKRSILFILIAISFFTFTKKDKNIYDFKVDALIEGKIDFKKFKGKKILIVNTASKCGLTGQYEELQKLYEDNKEKLVIVGFPANNFMKQEPGSNQEIQSFCTKNYGVTFPMAAKIDVKGKNIHPLYDWLINVADKTNTGKIRWNFEKFLFDEKGKLIERFSPRTKPLDKKITDLI